MKRRLISQRAARALQQRVRELEAADQQRRRAYGRDYPGGVHMATIGLAALPNLVGRLEASQRLKCALVARIDGTDLQVYALPQSGDAGV